MLGGTRLLLGALVLFCTTFGLRAAVPVDQSRGADNHISPIPPTTSEDYLGSKACARCHQAAFDHWEQSLHVKMTRPIAEATVLGDFRAGTRFSAHGRAFEFGRSAKGQPYFKVAFGSAKPETFSVDYTLGFKRYQGYLSMLSDGRMYVLPAFWHIESSRWIDWKEITPVPDGAHNLRQIWNTNCFNCHATNLARGFDVASNAYKTTWTEMGIGCEACHGPGRKHVTLIDASRQDPSLKPGGSLDIFSPRNGSPRQTFDTCAYCHGNKQNVFLGFRAGDRYEDYAIPFLISAPIPPTDLQGEFWPDGRPNRFNRPQALTLSGCFKAGEAVCTSCHVAHGSSNPFSLKLNITEGRSGDLLCTQCHEGRQLTSISDQRSALSDQLTIAGAQPSSEVAQPIAEIREPRAEGRSLIASGQPIADSRDPKTLSDAEIESHTYHRASSEGSRCISCHMSDVNWRLLIRRRDHTFQPPVPEMTAAFGVPNACTTCHDNRSPEWAARTMDQWWGDGNRRKSAMSLADTMYRAGSGDASVLPALARLAVDRSQGAVIRASAVEFIEQLALGTAGAGSADGQSQTSFAAGKQAVAGSAAGRGTDGVAFRSAKAPVELAPEQVNALIGAASDPEPMVRAQAVNALLATGQRDRVITPIVARLVDPARVVRARAAEALLVLGVSQLPGAAGEALARAQDDYATSLTDFPDVSANHTALGWLYAERNRTTEAHRALDDAIKLNPRAARPVVIKGVLAARAGRFGEASDLWRKAKGLEPTYPNIDQLIAEANKRK